MEKENISAVLGYRFRNKALLHRALTHPSFAFENNLPSNQRLEFLGDAVLSLIVAERLFRKLPEAPEGILTQRRADFVQKTTLAELGRKMALGRFLLLGKGEEKQGGRQTPSNLANVLESLIGAIYLDGGLEPARRFIEKNFFIHA